MKNTVLNLSLLLCCALLVSVVACSSENQSSNQDTQGNNITETEKEFLSKIEDYVASTLEEKGTLPVKTLEGKSVEFDGPLEMTKLHRKKVITYDRESNTYFVCSNFQSNPENGEGTKYDFDFFMTKTDDGWKLSDNLDWPPILLHKIEGEEQVTYKNNKPVAAN